jgi:very-short-patch-repair endonuclease
VTRRLVLPLEQQIALAKLPVPEREVRFHPQRRWRFDLAYRDRKLAIEIEGAVWVQGRHTRGSGYVADLEKYSEAAILGWRILRCTPQQVESGAALALVQRALGE